MNELQQVELKILESFLKVCEKLNLKYFLVCGTALGAVKYQGFIPWDDDIDVGLPRKDYEIFCAQAQKILPEYYFVQTYKTDKNFPGIYCKIRDSRTTYIEKSVAHLDINHGVYIDVFPLDGYPKQRKDIKYLEKKKLWYQRQLFCAYEIVNECSLKAKCFRKIGRILGIHKKTQKIVHELNRVLLKWDVAESDIICNHGNWQGQLEYASRQQYGNGVKMKFENLEVCVPKEYDAYLTQKYGDWRAELPVEQQVGHHYYEVCDLQRSYKEYTKRK